MSTLTNMIEKVESYLLLQQEERFDVVDVESTTLSRFVGTFSEDSDQYTYDVKTVLDEKEEPKAPTYESLKELNRAIWYCKDCALCKGREQAIAGMGNSDQPEILFVGHAPTGADDAAGEPFAGEIGELFKRMLKAMGYEREDVFLTTLVKCRTYRAETGRDRAPSDAEVQACSHFVKSQIAFMKPKLIVAFGQSATSGLLEKKVAINQVRGKWFEYEGIPMMPTFHPAEFERKPSQKRPVWEDLQSVMVRLGKPVKK